MRFLAFQISLIGILSLIIQSHIYAGSILGEVKFIGTPPKPMEIKVTSDQTYCGTSLPDESTLIGPNRGLKNSVIFIVKASQDLPPSLVENVLDNNGCRFAPHVLAMQRGEKLIVKNSDPKLHTIHTSMRQETIFNVPLPFRGLKIDVTEKIQKTGLIEVRCNTHGWMRGYIHVLDHPFFAVSDERGGFAIRNIPAGSYTLKAWHESAGVQSKEIVLNGRDDLRVNFEFKIRY